MIKVKKDHLDIRPGWVGKENISEAYYPRSKLVEGLIALARGGVDLEPPRTMGETCKKRFNPLYLCYTLGMVSITLYMVAAADRAIVTDSTKGIERPRNWDPCRMLKNTWGN